MSRITIYKSEQVAGKLTEHIKKQMINIDKEFSGIVNEYIEKNTPDKVVECFKSNPEYFAKGDYNSVYFNGQHIGYSRIITPIKYNANCVEVGDGKVGNKLVRIKQRQEKLEQKRDQLFREIKGALLSLRTYKKISEQFPEAVEYLDEPVKNELVVNLDSIRKQLKNK